MPITESSQHAKSLYPEMPLCIGYLSKGSTLNFVTSRNSDYTSLGYVKEKFPSIFRTFQNGEWYIYKAKVMSIGPVCYIKSHASHEENLLEIPLSEMELFEKICGEQRKRCNVCKVENEGDRKMKKCMGCAEKGVNILYCSENCQKKDWKKDHKNDCLYGAFPSENHEIFENDEEKCANCSSFSSSLKKCAGCHLVSYCDRDCQKQHWKSHKAECGGK